MNRNNINVFPHSTFNWVGIDGTQVLCHMTPVGTSSHPDFSTLPIDVLVHASDTYCAQATAEDIKKAVTNHKVPPTAILLHLLPQLILTFSESRVKLVVSSRFWKRRWRWWSVGKDAGECTAFTVPLEYRSLMSTMSWTAPSPPWYRKYVARTAGCAYGFLRR